MKNDTPDLETLYAGVGARRTPQHVAALLAQSGLAVTLPDEARVLLDRLIPAYHVDRGLLLTSGMPEQFHSPVVPTRAMESACAAMVGIEKATGSGKYVPAVPADVQSLTAWVDDALLRLGFQNPAPSDPVRRPQSPRTGWFDTSSGARGEKGGHVDIRERMNSAELAAALPGVSSRQYLKAVRAVAHLQQRSGVYAKDMVMHAAVMFGKTRLGYTISKGDFLADAPTAVFVAYYLARLGMRTEFTAGSQARPMDELGEVLLRHALDSPTCRADVIAKVLTRQSVLRRLTDEQKGDLVSEYFQTLDTIGSLLADTWRDGRDRARMVTQKGDDSTTWNMASRAWNQARTGWMNLMQGLGLRHVIEGICPGKVPALIAGDVAYWHADEGDDYLPSEVKIWAKLPEPWLALDGEVPCTADMVREACRAVGVDPETSGWTQPYRQTSSEETVSAPALINGVRVEDPSLLKQLKSSR